MFSSQLHPPLARIAAIKLEDGIRFDTLETGALLAPDGSILVRRQGRPDRVPFHPRELVHGAGGTFTHNHPSSTSFSVEDVRLAAEYQFKELRVVTRNSRYVMTDINGNVPKDIEQLFNDATAHVLPSVHDDIKLGRVGLSDFSAEVTHRAWRWLAGLHRFNYSRG